MIPITVFNSNQSSYRHLLSLMLLMLLSIPAAAIDIPLTPSSPFRVYSITEGLNQRIVHAVVQDQEGFLWIATFGGLNRFDGRTFESLTTRDGLRQNLIQALAIDPNGRIWAGDGGGGLTVIENGAVIRTFEPDPAFRGVVRGITVIGDSLYVGYQPGGVRKLSLNNVDRGFSRIANSPDEIYAMASTDTGELYFISTDGLHRLIDGAAQSELIRDDVTAVATDRGGLIAVGNTEGKIGWLRGEDIDWLDRQYDARISGLFLEDGVPTWVFVAEQGMIAFSEDSQDVGLPVSGTAVPMRDQEGVLWVPSRLGLARYLGERFTHYPIEIDRQQLEIFSIQPGPDGALWLGTNRGLLAVSHDGTITSMTDELGIDRREVRDIRLTDDGQTLWFGHIQEATYALDLTTRQLTQKLGDETTLTVGLTLDNRGRVWRGSFLGLLTMYDPASGEERSYNLGKGASIYSLAMSDDGYLWFTANFSGLHRINTNDATAEPELMVEEKDLQQEYYTHVIAKGSGADVDVWFAGIKGNVFRFNQGKLSRVFDASFDDVTVFSIQPLDDGTLVVATSRGVYRYDLTNGRLENYGALDGFTALEAKVHATYYDGGDQLLIGTASGVTTMDISTPFDGVTVPSAQITRRKIDDTLVSNTESERQFNFDEVMIEFTAVSTRKPNGIEYSYRLSGHDEIWSEPSSTTSISYSNLSPGTFTFAVRSRLPAGEWSQPSSWTFTVPTPLWREPWLLTLIGLALVALVWSIIQLRLRSIEKSNRRLRELVEERTRSIEEGRKKLELINDQLEYQANFDELTGLLNRRAFSEHLIAMVQDAGDSEGSFLMFLDLDQFKIVNDTCGHAAGDELLRMVADTLSGCVRGSDTVARLGGDEFALVILGASEDAALARAERVRQQIQDLEFLWESEVFRIGASIGVIPIRPNTQDFNELQQLADAACYAAKEAGRNRVHMVTSSEDVAHARRGEMRWVHRLNQAIDNDRFEIFGQRMKSISEPNPQTERIEILLRMRDRDSSRLIPPGAFLPAAERYGLQGRIDLWVIDRVIDMVGNRMADKDDRVEFWVNLSGVSVGDPQISREILRSVEAAKLRPGSLNFEITETAVIRKISEAKLLIAELQRMGCRFALDDFGSGLSSFGYLKQLSVDCLKIDGQFVCDINVDPTDRIFVKSIIDIAHTLGMEVITEFVENEEVLEIVQALGSDFAQGFAVHKPEPLSDILSAETASPIAALQ